MLMTEKGSLTKEGTNEESDEHTIATDNNTVPLDELLVNSTVPTTAVAIKVCDDSTDEAGRGNNEKRKRGILSNFQRRTFSRISFKGETGPLLSRYRQTRFSSRRIRKRVVFKHGDCNVVQGNVAKRRRRYLQDIFTTLVDAQWRWTLLVFSMNFLLSWLGFALIWWLIAYSHGDLDLKNQNNPNITFTPCIREIRGFTSSFLFSIETQHTIGYGSKHPTDECPEAVFVICIQSMTGVILQAFMVGIVFAKLSRPKKRTQTLLFSRNAVICQRDGQPCLMFRVGDMRKSHIIEAHVRAQMIKRKVTREGELLPFFQTELKVGGDGEEDKIFFIWPTTIVHKIDEKSPLYHISASDMLRERFEIIVMLEGVIESTGMTTQARSSYLPSEILWGHRFEHIITFKKETGEYEVNYSLFNNTYEVDTPLCSAADLDKLRTMQRSKGGISERASNSGFAHYRDASSSSLTTGSGSSLASSTGGLHMNVPMTLTPIPVMITGPDGSLRRESMQSAQTDLKQSIFYTHNEFLDGDPHVLNHYSHEELRNQEDYDRVLEDINATLRKNRAPSKEDRRIHREPSKCTLDSRKSESRDTIKRSSSRTTMDQVPVISSLSKSPSRQHLDPRHTKFAESSEAYREPSPHPLTSSRSSLGENHKGPQKKTSFILGDVEHHVIDMEPMKEFPSRNALEGDSSKTNHLPRHAVFYQEQV
ncbi:inward rectifier potassium channel 16-like isoform X1 [Bombus vosnesenskii]|uniref:Inward rectifier potassium channel 16-like isoform X1 n=1 Tax=Bombus vosnesenskii TaxID=207650 RepID=A0A6J3LL62_9HYME|nr:inward rectifier potassium channel 16-like isoform X1 [Bombus vosnesenskii]XP_050489610.1 inward rectifier potassium channel 16-like isoform X1 [Bombus huntii]XP_050489612.1 inward rectifier potassium channel 16-like isoform X1 [Bombus huntii]